MPKPSTQADHYEMKTRYKRRVGQPEGNVWSVYNRGPQAIDVKWATAGGEVTIKRLHPDCILSSWIQPVVQMVESGSVNFTVVTYFNG
jgi:hypothetical protein